MPERITIAEAARHVGETVEIPGWLYNLRKSGKIVFPILRDGTGIIQCVALKSALPEDVFEELKHLTQESSLVVRGTIRAEARAHGGYEMDVESVDIVQKVPESDPYPITPKEHGVDFLMDHRHLWLRSQRQHAIIRVRHEVIKAVRDYFDSHGFTLVDTPIFTPAACEGTTTLFEVNYFDDDKAYLTQSGQLYNEATAMAFGKVYCFGPTFRAEKSKTRRHLTEFWMVEPEMAFADLNEIKRVAEEMVIYVVGRVLDQRREELKVLERDATKLEAVQAPFPRMSYDDAVKNLREHGSEIQWGSDFGGGDETILTQQFDRPIMVDRFPSAIKAFYMAPDPDRPEVALGVDVLAPEGYGEIIGGGQRIHDPELLLRRIEEHQLPREAFEWYIDLRKYGTVPHGGFGMGIERCVAWVCGLEHVRETIAFPRMLYRLRPVSRKGIAIIGAPLDLGAGRRGVDMGPSAVRVAGLGKKLIALGYDVADLGNVPVAQAESVGDAGPSEAKYLTQIAATCERLGELAGRALADGKTPLVLGGDHSIAVGTVAGVSRFFRESNRKIGLVWMDAHADMNTPQSSPSGNVHGMPLTCCAGVGPDELARMFGFAPKVDAANIALVGVRDVVPLEGETVRTTGVHTFTMREIDERGMRAVMGEAIAIATKGMAGFHLSVDMDFVDPQYAPGVGTPVRGGATYREAHLAMEMICDSGKMVSMEVVEVNPVIDEANRTADLAVELILSAMGKKIL